MIIVRLVITNFTWILLITLVTNVVELTIQCVLLVTTYSVLSVYGLTMLILIHRKDNVFRLVSLNSRI